MELKITTSLEDEILFKIFMIEEEFIEIELLQDLDPVDVVGVSFSGGKKKSKVEIPRYMANYYVVNGQAKYTVNDTYNKLINALKQQKPSFKLNQIPDSLLLSTLNLLGKNSVEDETDSQNKPDIDYNKNKETFTNLITDRLKKILRDIAINDYATMEKNLDDLEKPLIKAISNLIQEYYKFTNLDQI